MDTKLLVWTLFWVIATVALFIDLSMLNKPAGNVKTKKAATMVCVWTSVPLIFGVVIYFVLGQEKALEYLAGYVVEYSLSVDNIFVFLMIFSYFTISKANQSKVLIYGIVGAVILRFLFILVGIKLTNTFRWAMCFFGVLLVCIAIKMLYENNKKTNSKRAVVYNVIKKLIPLKDNTKSNSFFIRENKKIYATPMFASLIVVEMNDLIFAVDSIPAVLSISKDTFIVYSSNIFAIMGLRSLYFLISNFVSKFEFLRIGTAIILTFVGLKMILFKCVSISAGLSLSIIISILGTSILVSTKNKKKANLIFD